MNLACLSFLCVTLRILNAFSADPLLSESPVLLEIYDFDGMSCSARHCEFSVQYVC